MSFAKPKPRVSLPEADSNGSILMNYGRSSLGTRNLVYAPTTYHPDIGNAKLKHSLVRDWVRTQTLARASGGVLFPEEDWASSSAATPAAWPLAGPSSSDACAR